MRADDRRRERRGVRATRDRGVCAGEPLFVPRQKLRQIAGGRDEERAEGGERDDVERERDDRDEDRRELFPQQKRDDGRRRGRHDHPEEHWHEQSRASLSPARMITADAIATRVVQRLDGTRENVATLVPATESGKVARWGQRDRRGATPQAIARYVVPWLTGPGRRRETSQSPTRGRTATFVFADRVGRCRGAARMGHCRRNARRSRSTSSRRRRPRCRRSRVEYTELQAVRRGDAWEEIRIGDAERSNPSRRASTGSAAPETRCRPRCGFEDRVVAREEHARRSVGENGHARRVDRPGKNGNPVREGEAVLSSARGRPRRSLYNTNEFRPARDDARMRQVRGWIGEHDGGL